MSQKEAAARIKINKLLDQAGWRFEDGENGPANIHLEPGVKISELGDDFEGTSHGFIDFLLLDTDGRPLVVVEAKKESIEPLAAKEQARTYARNVDARFVILSNGNIHYLWDTKHGYPETISRFPDQKSITQYESYIPNPAEMANAAVDENYIVATQMPVFANDPDFQNEETRPAFMRLHKLKQLRDYQLQAIKNLQSAAADDNNRFLFEMATGTGKTLTAAAVIKLFLKSGNARRVLFLVDRLELEDQAEKAFKLQLGKDFTTMIYKEHREGWRNAKIVVSTVQTFLAGDRYRKEFSPTDFELVISDEAHRSIGGNSRAVFEYFVGYKLGLTATPKDYLKGANENGDAQRDFERRQLLDTYKTFGCASGEPTFRYGLLEDGGRYLVNPIVVDARTEITAKLLSDKGYAVHSIDSDGGEVQDVYNERHFERKFFNEETNIAMCKALIDSGLYDPIAKELGVDLFGKTVIFCVSQNHAGRVANILNRFAFERWPDRYGESDFAMQVSSHVSDAQQMTINFANNQLGGKDKSIEGYETSKARVCVTVGMMTTGYDCEDILNVALMRPIFSPSDFVQIKGRGTRKFEFEYESNADGDFLRRQKERFKLFDFFANCEYFETEFKYDEQIKLPVVRKASINYEPSPSEFVNEKGESIFKGPIDLRSPDELESISEIMVGEDGMRIDREGFRRAVADDVVNNKTLKALWENGDLEEAEEYTKKHVFNKSHHFLNLEKIKKAFNLDRRVSIKEFLQVAFRQKAGFEMKDDLLESEWQKFQEITEVDQGHYTSTKHFFKAFIVDEEVRNILQENALAKLEFCPSLSLREYVDVNGYQKPVQQYVKDYVSLNTFMN